MDKRRIGTFVCGIGHLTMMLVRICNVINVRHKWDLLLSTTAN